MNWQEHVIDARRLYVDDAAGYGPMALIDLDVTCETDQELRLPPCPVIGFGNPAHALARQMDTLVEKPLSTAMLVRQISACPRAAGVIVELLRILPGLDVQAGLLAESLAYGLLQGSGEHARWLSARERHLVEPAPGQLLVSRDDATLRLAIDGAPGNAIDRGLRDELDAAFVVAALDATITRIILTARGRTFCLGADLAEFGTTPDPATAHGIRRRTLPARHIARCADRLEVHVQGGCVGAGLEMAAWARHLTARPDAWFQLPELAMGLLPGAGGCVALTRRIGRQRAALLMLSGKRISAQVALEWGMIEAIVNDLATDDGRAHVVG